MFGMPKEAVARGGVDHTAPLGQIPKLALKLAAD